MPDLISAQSSTAALVLRSIFPDTQHGRVAINSNIVITFSESVVAGDGYITINNGRGETILQESITSPRITISGSVVTLNPEVDFEFLGSYEIRLSSGLVKTANGISYVSYGNSVANFTTEFGNVPVNFTGSSDNEVIYGSTAGDVLNGGAGSDRIEAHDGDDIVNGGDEENYFIGGGDTIYGGSGNDVLHGDGGGDFIFGDAGNDKVFGDADKDRLLGGEGDDELDGGAGDDIIEDFSGNNILRGGEGNDTLNTSDKEIAGAFNQLDGGAGSDKITASGADDVMGGEGDDLIYYKSEVGSSRSATIDGGSGNDYFYLSLNASSNTMNVRGGEGQDAFVIQNTVFTSDSRYTITDFSAGTGGDKIDLRALIGSLPQYEKNPFSADGYLRLVADGQNTLLQAKSSVQENANFYTVLTLQGLLPNQLNGDNFVGGINPNGSATGMNLIGTSGPDVLNGYILNDYIFGGSGPDTLYGGAGNDVLIGGDENSVNDNDVIYDQGGDDLLRGGAGDDSIYGSDGNDTLEGGSGNDILSDSVGYNIIRGGDGDDAILIASTEGGVFEGGNGNDLFTINVYGKARNIKITGGAGTDIINLVNSNVETITITDFSVIDGDALDLRSPLRNITENPFGSGAYLKVTQEGNNVVVHLDEDGANGSKYAMHPIFTLLNVTVPQLDGTSFIGGWNPNGSNEGEIIRGTASDEVFDGKDLNDIIFGNGGADTIRGGKGKDKLSGDAGADALYGDDGNDTLIGGADNDKLHGGDGDDTLDGGEGNDYLNGDNGKNILRGGNGNDDIYSNGYGDTVEGGDGDDKITTPGGIDSIYAGAGNDKLTYGDMSYGSYIGITQIDLGDGNDTLNFVPNIAQSKAIVRGGSGVNTYQLRAAATNSHLTITDFKTGAHGDIIDLFDLLNSNYKGGNPFSVGGLFRLVQKDKDTVIEYDQDGPNSYRYNFEALITLSDLQANTLNGSNFTHGINPNGGNEGLKIQGGMADDDLRGGILNDQIFGRSGNDKLNGGLGNDTLFGGEGKDQLSTDSGDDTLNGDNGDDELTSSGHGRNQLNGGAGNDIITAGDGNDTLNGEDGDDRILISFPSLGGIEFNRQVFAHGGNGHDQIIFSPGLDTSQGKVIVSGGAGIDTFIIRDRLSNFQFTITDFTPGAQGDYLDFSALISYLLLSNNPFGEIGFTRLVQRGQDTVLQFDIDGVAGPKQFQDLLTLQGVQSSSLTSANFVGNYSPNGIDQGVIRNGDAQNDTLKGSNLDDVLSGQEGNDLIEGGFGNDRLFGGDGDDELSDDSGDNSFDGGNGNDLIRADSDGENVGDGGAGNDVFFIAGSNGNFNGGDGDDAFTVTSNLNSWGSTRSLALFGGAGSDQFTVSGYFDKNLQLEVTGGLGPDLYIPRIDYSADTFKVLDFDVAPGGDTISLNAILEDIRYSRSIDGNPFAKGYLSLQQIGSDTLLLLDRDGAGGNPGEAILILKGVTTSQLNQSHFAELFDPQGSANGVVRSGDMNANRLIGGWSKDSLSGLDGNDYLDGKNDNDVLNGGAGDDTLVGGMGDDEINGGTGFDTAVFPLSLSAYKLSKNATGIKVEDRYLAGSGTDQLVGIEYLRFDNVSINLGVKDKAATIAAKDLQMLIELYVAFFNRTPDADGVSYWIDEFKGGKTIVQISEAFYFIGASEQFAALTGFTASMTNEDFIHTFYRNVLGRTNGADEGGLNYWNNKLLTGASTRGSLAQDILNAAHTFKGNAEYGYVADLLDNKYLVGRTVAVDWGITYVEQPYERGVSIAAAVTPSDTSAAFGLVGVAASEVSFF